MASAPSAQAAEPGVVGVEGGEEVIRAPAPAEAPAPPPSQLAGARTVITREQFAAQSKTVADVLETVPGVTIVSSGDPLAPARVSIRGSRPDQVLVVLDGVPLNVETANPARARGEGRMGVDLAALPLDRVASIEVVRGAAGSAYGPGAAAGAVLIRTRRVREEHVEAHRKIGAGGFRETAAEWSHPSGEDGFELALNLKQTNGEFLFYDPQAGAGTGTGAADPCLEDRGGGYFLRKCNAKRSGTLSAAWERGEAQRWNLEVEQLERQGLGGVQNARPSAREERLRYQVGLSQGWRGEGQDEARLALSALRLFSRATDAAGGGLFDSHFQETRGDGDLWAERWWGRHRLRVGAAAFHQQLDDRFFEAGRDRASVYGQWNGYLEEGALEGSLRYDAYSDVASRATWRLAATRKLAPSWGLKASAGSGYRPPTLYELYDPGSPAGPSAANPNLRPESSVSADGGAFLELGGEKSSDLRVEVLAFRQELSDAIVAIADPASPNLFRFQNVARTRSTGIEASLGVRLPGGFAFDGSATALRAVIVSNAGNDVRDEGHRVPGVAERQATAGLSWRSGTGSGSPGGITGNGTVAGGTTAPGWSAYWKVRYRDRRFVDTANSRFLLPYATHEAGLRFPLRWGFEGALEGTNLTNQTYAELDNFPAPGRQLFLTLRWRGP